MIEVNQQKGLVICLKSLFSKNDIAHTLAHFREPIKIDDAKLVSLMRYIDKERVHYTLDQYCGYAHMLNTVWVKEEKTSANLKYAGTPSVFNTLLHFVDNGVLMIKDGKEIVCHWESLLRWHDLSSSITEDLLTCAYLASHDLADACSGYVRKDFSWPAYIMCDDHVLRAMMELPLADIHAHLKGSSLNFDINWLCLMNNVERRKSKLDKLQASRQEDNGITTISLYRKVMIAAAIRLWLFQLDSREEYMPASFFEEFVNETSDEFLIAKAKQLQQYIESAKATSKAYVDTNGVMHHLDYAIVEGKSVPHSKQERCAYSLLSGERYLMYNILGRIYNGETDGGRIESLFYIYLLIKNEIRHEINQLNNAVGFGNFAIYEERKTLFVKGYAEYSDAALHLAVASFFTHGKTNLRYHEARITPCNLGCEIVDSIRKYDLAINNPMFKTETEQWEYRYIFHFIKQPDVVTAENEGDERHKNLRNEVKTQAHAIVAYRNSQEKHNDKYLADRAVGIDAANSEIACRPEVFGQAFRFLRGHRIDHPELHQPADLGITFHVGEDFMEVVDGLRAIEEALLFLQLRKGDRLGHALALGVDVRKYYKSRNYTIPMSLQMQLDNSAWMYHHLKDSNRFHNVASKMKESFASAYDQISGDKSKALPSIDLYYSSMLLRGDDPKAYHDTDSNMWQREGIDPWSRKALNDNALCIKARKHVTARNLYHDYHYDVAFKRNSNTYTEWVVSEEMIDAIEYLQSQMLRDVESKGLAIECNPTSNYKIGDFDRYEEHPIQIFNSIAADGSKQHAISVSINTDDKGVFSTSIEREYALIAHSMIRKYRAKNAPMVYDWLDRVRRYSVEQIFDKSVKLSEPIANKSLEEISNEIIAENDKRVYSMNFLRRLQYALRYLRLRGDDQD